MRVQHAKVDSLAAICAAYEAGRQRQRALGAPEWPVFAEQAILSEIAAGQLFLVLREDALAGVFTVVYEDPAIWDDAEQSAYLYLHRIARAEAFDGRGMIDAVLAWARAECTRRGCAGLRMDTWANNETLIAYYQRLGFRCVGRKRIVPDPRLPPHYHNLELALLEAS